MIRKVLLFLFLFVNVQLEAQVREMYSKDKKYVVCNGKSTKLDKDQEFNFNNIADIKNSKSLSIYCDKINYRDLSELIPNLDFLEIGTNTDSLVANFKYLRNVKRLKLVLFLDLNFPKEIFDLPNLKELVITGALYEVPSEIAKAQQLESFAMCRFYCLKQIPKEIYLLPNLLKFEIYEFWNGEFKVNNLQISCESSLDNSKIQDFYKLTKLKYLDIQILGLNEVPSGISNLKDLENLYISGQVKSLPNDFTELKKLKVFKWDFCDLHYKELKQICSLSGIEELALTNCHVKMLPTNFGELYNLKKLDLSDNDLFAIPDMFYNLSNLEELDLGSNEISEFTSDIGKLKNLRILNLRSNHISKLPKEIGQLSSLRSLNLSSNSFYDDFNWITVMENIEVLDFSENKIHKFNDSVFKNIQKLKIFRLEVSTIYEGVAPYNLLKNRELSELSLGYLNAKLPSVDFYCELKKLEKIKTSPLSYQNDSLRLFYDQNLKNCLKNLSSVELYDYKSFVDTDKPITDFYNDDFQKEIKKLIKLKDGNPNNLKFSVDLVTAYCNYAWDLIDGGEYEKALFEINNGLKIDNNNKTLQIYYPIALFCAGDVDNAMSEFSKNNKQIFSQNKSGKISYNKMYVTKLKDLHNSDHIGSVMESKIEKLIIQLSH